MWAFRGYGRKGAISREKRPNFFKKMPTLATFTSKTYLAGVVPSHPPACFRLAARQVFPPA
jgi:hypothetical protein